MSTKRTRSNRFDAYVEYTREDGSTGGVAFGGDSLDETLADAFKHATYCLALGYEVTTEVTVRCTKCDGSGEVPKRGQLGLCPESRKPCPACRGKDPERRVTRFECVASRNVRILDAGKVTS